MTKNEKIVIAIAAAKVGVSVAYYLHVRSTERKKRAAISQKTVQEMAAIHYAGEVVKSRIASGYRYPSIVDIETDFAFERIAYFEKD